MTTVDAALESRANQLYWSSDESVNTIAEELNLSKGTLYNIIQPIPTGLACPECSEELEFPNRTARERGMVACGYCDFEGSAEDGEPMPQGARRLGDSIGSAVGGILDSSELGRQRTLIGGALLGAAAGLALILWTRRR